MALWDMRMKACRESAATDRINVYKFTDAGGQNIENASRFVAERCIFLLICVISRHKKARQSNSQRWR